MTNTSLDELKGNGHTPGPWKADSDAHGIWCRNERIGGESKIFDVRGWGYLTGRGHGALGLSDEAATAIQHANAKLAAGAPELREALVDLIEIIDAAGLINLSNGVQLGATSWYVKASDRLSYARKIITKATGAK